MITFIEYRLCENTIKVWKSGKQRSGRCKGKRTVCDQTLLVAQSVAIVTFFSQFWVIQTTVSSRNTTATCPQAQKSANKNFEDKRTWFISWSVTFAYQYFSLFWIFPFKWNTLYAVSAWSRASGKVVNYIGEWILRLTDRFSRRNSVLKTDVFREFFARR